jgi:uncharacterized membrane protein YeaQ/YmgE (transglycosylase-associated protein family)
MTNFLVLLAIGAALGWLATAWRRQFRQSDMLINIIGGALASFSAGLAANGRGLYAGLSALGLIGSVAGALIILGVFSLLRLRHPR